MGNSKKTAKKERKKLKKRLKKERKSLFKELVPAGCKTKCCEKYQKGEQKRCKRCPCFDLIRKVA